MVGLFAVKFVKALYLLPDEKPSWAVFLHRYPAIDISLIFLVSIHTCFGLKNILFELGLREGKLLVYARRVQKLYRSISSWPTRIHSH